MFKVEPPPPYFPVATEEQARDRESWVNTSHEIPVDAYVEFFVSLGEGIAAWSIVEYSLYNIADMCIQPSRGDALLSAFHSLTTFRTKLDFTNAAVLRSLTDEKIENEWAPLYNKLVKKSRKRNAMAHCEVYYDHNEPSMNRKYSALLRKLTTIGCCDNRKW